MLTDLLSGRLDASAIGAAAIIPFIESGKVRCIATGSAKRLPQLLDVPTVATAPVSADSSKGRCPSRGRRARKDDGPPTRTSRDPHQSRALTNGPPMPTDFERADNLHRPPMGATHAPTGRPLIITPTFVSRVDSTPRDQRPQDGGASRDREGREVRHPDRRPEALAIEADRNIAFEHWDEYWRKVHGPKFAWDEPGSSSALVLRYDQLHRLASGPSSCFPPPYRAMVDEEGRLPSDPERRVPAHSRSRWDGLACIAYETEEDIRKVLGQEKFDERIVADEQTAFRTVTRGIAREHILIPSERHRDPVSLVKIHVRLPGLSREAFQHRLLGEHAERVIAHGATRDLVRRYAQLHPIGSTQEDPEGSRIDAVSILSFACMNDVEDFLVHPDHGGIEASENALAGGASEWWTAVNYSVINRLMPEVATDMNLGRKQ